MSRDKVLLFFPSYRSVEAAPSVALLALAPIAENRGYKVDIIDSTVEPRFLERIGDQLDETACVGVSIVTGPMIEDAIKVGNAVKARTPHVPVVFGGWHPSTLAGQTLQAPFVDAVVSGQGELTFGEILDRFREGRDLHGVQGCSFKTGDGQIVHNPPRPTVSVSDLPPKAYHLVDLEPYAALCGRRWMYYMSSQGCPYDCSFCSNASLYGRAWHALRAERVVNEVTELVRKFRLELVDVTDDNFLVDRQRGIDIAKGFIASGERFDWCIQTTANFLLRMSDDDVKLMRRSGLSRVFIGAESGSDDVLRSVNKVRFQGKRVIYDVSEKCQRAGITCTFSLIFALPDESESDRRSTLAMVREIKSKFPATEFHSNIYTPYPGAPNFRRAVEMGLREPRSLEEWAGFYPKFQRLPWVDDSRHEKIQRMREDIRIAYGAVPIRRKSRLRKLANSVLGPIAKLRLRLDQYEYPLELWSLRAISHILHSLGHYNVKTHIVQS